MIEAIATILVFAVGMTCVVLFADYCLKHTD